MNSIRPYSKIAIMAACLIIFACSYLSAASCSKRLLAYYPYWNSNYRADKIQYTKLTHICHAFAAPQADGSLYADPGPPALLEPALITNAHVAGVKVLISIGGASTAGQPPDSTFRTISQSAALRTAFANSIVTFCSTYGYDGVDIDWEMPGAMDPGSPGATDRANFNLMIQAIRNAFNSAPAPAPTWLISIATSSDNWGAQWLDYPTLNNYVDFYNDMTYDMHGSWNLTMGYNAPLYQGNYAEDNLCDATCMDYILTTRGVPAAKVNMGIPFYGQYYPGPNTLFYTCGNCSTTEANYNAIQPLIGNGWTYHWDSGSQVPYLTNDAGTGIYSYDDPQSVAAKADYALNSRNAGGIFMWDLSEDYFAGTGEPLLDAMYSKFNTFCSGSSPTFTPTGTRTMTFTATYTRTSSRTATPTPSITSTTGAAACQNIALALYEDPSYAPGTADWSTAVSSAPVVSLLVANPNNGPDTVVHSYYTTAIANAHAAGQKVLGYVYSSYGARTLTAVETDVDTWYSFYPGIDGIFVDEVTNDGTHLADWYTPMSNYIRAKPGSHIVVMNPGSQTTEAYMSLCDIVMNFESDYNTYVSSYSAPSWVNNYPANRFWHIVFTTPAMANMQNAVTLSRQRNAGYIEITDLDGSGNPYAQLASYFSAEITAVGASCSNASPTNSPSATITSSRTGTPTVTPTPTGSTVITVTFSFTRTLTVTLTPTGTATFTVSLTQSPSFTPTSTRTTTPSITITLTLTSISTGTPTYTGTITNTYTETPNYSPTDSVTGTPPTSTVTPSVSPSSTAQPPSFTPTLTRTTTPSITLTLTLTSTLTGTPTFTRTQPPSSTTTAVSTPSPTTSFTFTPTATATAGAEGTVFEVKDVVIYPDPVFAAQSMFYVNLNISRTPQSVMMKIYTAAFRAIRGIEWTTGIKRGDNSLSVPMSKLGHISNGTYYYVIIVKDTEGQQARSKTGEFIILR